MYLACTGVIRRTAQTSSTWLGSFGWVLSFIPTSFGSRFPFRLLHGEQAATTFPQSLAPPRETGTTWSRVRNSRPLSSDRCRPQYWQE